MIKAAFAASLLISSSISTAGTLTIDQFADSVDESKQEAWVASEKLRLHMADISQKQGISNVANECIEYGMLLRGSARDRIFDADLIMTGIYDDVKPPNRTQRFSANVIYLAAKQDLEQAILRVDECFSAGGPFK